MMWVTVLSVDGFSAPPAPSHTPRHQVPPPADQHTPAGAAGQRSLQYDHKTTAVPATLLAAGAGIAVAASYYLYHWYSSTYRQHRYTNHLAHVTHLNNNYYGMRHGESQANIMHLISSDPTVATHSHGLTPTGKLQAQSSARQWADQHCTGGADDGGSKRQVVVISSDFLRASQTAETLATACDTTVHYTPVLRERHFGTWNGTSDDNYNKVWQSDARDANHIEHDVESVMSVVDRVTRLILQLDKQYNNANIILVAHGDVLQITQTAFAKTDPRYHRLLKHLPQAEIRPLPLAQE